MTAPQFTPPTAEQMLMGGGIPSATSGMKMVGSMVSGTIEDVAEPTQATEFGTREPKVWQRDKSPIWVIKVTLQTQLRDPANPDDDGKRALWMEQGTNLIKSVTAAVRAAGAPMLRPGGYLTIQYTGDGLASQPGLNPPKLYNASYQPPAATAMMGAPEITQTQPAMQTQAPAQVLATPFAQQPIAVPAPPPVSAQPFTTAAVQPPAAPGITPEILAALAATGMTPEAIAALAASGLAAGASVQ